MAQSRTDIRFGDLGSGFQIGINSGPIHLPPERPETPPNPLSTVPFLRDPDYIDRQALLERVHAKCSIPASRTALVGLGGVGKSQLAIEYSYQIRNRLLDTWVFWVHASNAARLEQSYREIADRAKIAGRKDLKANVFKLVYDWLCDEKNGKWLLILDNVDHARLLHKTSSLSHDRPKDGQSGTARQLLRAFLPQSQNGSILMTMRNREVALKLVEQRDIITVEPMDKAHAVRLFEKKLGIQGDSKEIAELSAALEFMPLAIVQAAAYITQRAPRCSVQQYLEEFRKSDRKKTSLLNHEGGHLRRDWEARNSIITTWEISFDYIHENRPSAADLLSLMSFFDRQGIPVTLVRSTDIEQNYQNLGGFDMDDEDTDEDGSLESIRDHGFEDDILTLRNYSFISANADKTTFEMHGLVQLATRMWLSAHGQLERWRQQYIKNLGTVFPTGKYENWETCQSLFPHAKSAVAQRPDNNDSLKEWASLLYNAAWYALDKGNLGDAEKMSEQAMKARRSLFGQDHRDTLSCMAILASTCRKLGQWQEAEELDVQVLEARKRVLGVEHPSTLTSMGNLAATYRNQGRWQKAEELEVQVLEARKRVLGAEHPYTLTSMNNLAATYMNQGRWQKAEEIQVQVLEARKRALGAEHPYTLTSMNNLASTFWNQGRWQEAEELEVQVLEARKRALGAEHPDTLTSMNNLAATYMNQGRWQEAEELQVQVLEATKRALGAEHPDTLTSMNNLALTFRNQGRWQEAEELQVQVLEATKRALGAEHPDTLTSMNNLASTFWNQGRWQEAEELEVLVLEASKRVLGTEHPDTLTSMANLAFTRKEQGQDTEALKLIEECVQLQTRVLGINHPDTNSSSVALSQWKYPRPS